MFGIFDYPHPDPNPLPLTTSPWPILLLLTSYYIFVMKLGKIYMQNREPYVLKRTLMCYNLGQVAYNGIMFSITFYYIIIARICNLNCMESFPIGHEHKNLERYVHFAFFANKIIDLLDTIFFVARKSYRQITFLHVYHHMLMVLVGYLMMRFYGTGGHVISIGLVNSFVHTVMYFYYFWSAFYPSSRANLWWKKYITIIQLVQFAFIFVYTAYVMVIPENCHYPRILLWTHIVQAIAMMYLFGNFYLNAYIRTERNQKVK